MLKVGCCGFPKGMKRYFSEFRLVEMQQTFYRPPRLETALRWRDEAPADFEFSIKAWQMTREIATALRARAIVFQCPPSFRERGENIENLRSFFGALKEGDFLFVWEPWGDWREDTIRMLCQELGLVHCVDPMEREPLHGETRYFRLHGGPGYRHRYTDEELKGLSDRWGGEGGYFLFNNLSMYEDALRFVRLVRRGGG